MQEKSKKSIMPCERQALVYWINTIVVPCLHYFGAYELMGHNSSAQDTAQAEQSNNLMSQKDYDLNTRWRKPNGYRQARRIGQPQWEDKSCWL